MTGFASLYKRHRFPPEIIQHAVWLYHRFNLSTRDKEDLLAERGIAVSYESIRLWCIKFGPRYARRLKRRHRDYGDTFFIDEVFVKIRGKQHYLWRAVDQDGEVVDVFLQARRDSDVPPGITDSLELDQARFDAPHHAACSFSCTVRGEQSAPWHHAGLFTGREACSPNMDGCANAAQSRG